MDFRGSITLAPGKRIGQPCTRGLRITVEDVLDYLAGGMSEDDILTRRGLGAMGNCRTAEVEALLRGRVADVRALVADPDATLLILAQYSHARVRESPCVRRSSRYASDRPVETHSPANRRHTSRQ